MFGTDEFIKKAKEAVLFMAIDGLDPTDNPGITIDDIYFVTCTFVLGHIKAMLSTNLQDGKYYEVTYNNDKKEMYVVQYVRTHQMRIPITDTND